MGFRNVSFIKLSTLRHAIANIGCNANYLEEETQNISSILN
jgi:hypothetical protein